MTDEYGYITFQDREIVVIGDVPQRTLIELPLLLGTLDRGVHVIDPDILAFGRHEDGSFVWYQVVGWDRDRKGLILELDTMMREVGKK